MYIIKMYLEYIVYVLIIRYTPISLLLSIVINLAIMSYSSI